MAVLLLLMALPERMRLMPPWAGAAVALAVLTPMIVVGATRGSPRWLRIERAAVLAFAALATLGNVVNLRNVLQAMVHGGTEAGALELLSSSVAIWVTNVFTFSLFFWQIDRGGPEARVRETHRKPDWLFPQEGAPPEIVAPGWRPDFVDYLFLAFSTATAFSATDVMPVTRRAKTLMMLESSIALVTVVVVGARAINILGT